MKLLPNITTITPGKWRERIKEVKKFKLTEIAVFPTCLKEKERKELYELLKETSVKKIPLVHIRNDMQLWELKYFKKTYGTKFFSTHTAREYPPLFDYGKLQKSVCIENNYQSFDEEEIKKFGGICLDLSHLENDRLMRPAIYRADVAVLNKYPPKCGHISAVQDKVFLDSNGQERRATHRLTELSQLDYLKRYPKSYFQGPLAIELENSIEEQLEAVKYLNSLIIG